MANGAVSVDVVMLHRHTMALSNRPDRVQDTDRQTEQTEQSESSITTMRRAGPEDCYLWIVGCCCGKSL